MTDELLSMCQSFARSSTFGVSDYLYVVRVLRERFQWADDRISECLRLANYNGVGPGVVLAAAEFEVREASR